MHQDHDKFIEALNNKLKVSLTFYSKEDEQELTRLCAPMDYGPSRRTKDDIDRYHLWDYESDTKNHTLSLKEDQIKGINPLNIQFDPAEFITWDTAQSTWFYKRDWGKYS